MKKKTFFMGLMLLTAFSSLAQVGIHKDHPSHPSTTQKEVLEETGKLTTCLANKKFADARKQWEVIQRLIAISFHDREQKLFDLQSANKTHEIESFLQKAGQQNLQYAQLVRLAPDIEHNSEKFGKTLNELIASIQ